MPRRGAATVVLWNGIAEWNNPIGLNQFSPRRKVTHKLLCFDSRSHRRSSGPVWVSGRQDSESQTTERGWWGNARGNQIGRVGRAPADFAFTSWF